MLRKVVKEIRFFLGKCQRDEIGAYAAQAAFFIMLSIFPTLMLFIALIQYSPVTQSMLMDLVQRFLPDYISPLMISIINEMFSRNTGLIPLTVLTTLWSAGKGIHSLANGLNSVYEIPETRNWFFLRFRAVMHTVVALLTIVLALSLEIFGVYLERLLARTAPWLASVAEFIFGLSSFFMFLIFILFFVIVYKFLPNRKAKFRTQLLGSVLSAVAWTVFSAGLSIYHRDFQGFTMYGSLTTIILVMLWLYFGMYILMLGGEVNSIYGEQWIRRPKEGTKTVSEKAD